MEVIGKMKEIAKQNVVFKHIFRGREHTAITYLPL